MVMGLNQRALSISSDGDGGLALKSGAVDRDHARVRCQSGLVLLLLRQLSGLGHH